MVRSTSFQTLLVLMMGGAVMSGCGQSVQTPLPDLNSPDPGLTAADGERAIKDLQTVNATKKAETIKQIEQAH